jgi:hypothetical protein
MRSLVANTVSVTEAVKLLGEGGDLLCPICGAIIKTLPERWVKGTPLHGIECPTDQRHFMVHFDDAATMREMRDRMRARSPK